MKKYISLFILVSFCSLSLCAQTQKNRTVERSLNNNFMEFKIPVAKEGQYSIQVVQPDGSFLSIPVKDKRYSKGQSINLTLNSKYWKNGMYRIQVIQNGRIVDWHSVNVGLSAKQRARISKQ